MAKRAQQESGEGRVTDKSRPMMNLTARTPSFVCSSASSHPGRTSYGYQDPGRSVPIDDRTGKPVETSRSDYLQEDYGLSWSSQGWKSGAAAHDRSGKLEKTSWDSLQKVDPHREEYLLGRNAHSARYRETIHDPMSENLQEHAYFENFVMGSDAAEFVNKVKERPSADSTEKNVEHCKVMYRRFNNVGNVHGYDIKCSDIHGNEFLNCSKCCQESWKSYLETDVRCHSAISQQSGRN